MTHPVHLRLATLTIACIVGALSTTSADAVPVTGRGTWETTLQARDINGDGIADAYYDTRQNISWLADAFAEGPPPGFPAGRPLLSWNDAFAYASALDVYGTTDWRLPKVIDVGNATSFQRSCPPSTRDGSPHGLCGYNNYSFMSELSDMYYVTLGNGASLTVLHEVNPDGGLKNTGPFSQLAAVSYWSQTRNGGTGRPWVFDMGTGFQDIHDPFTPGVATWVVHDGDVGVAMVPEPSTTALLLAGGMALVGLRGVKRKTV